MEKIAVFPNILKQMFPWQKELLEHYIELEGMPRYPLDFDKKPHQKLLKDFISRFTEELAEAYAHLEKGLEAAATNKFDEAREHVADYNLEMGDAWHFLLELMVFMGVEEDQLEDMVRAYVAETMYASVYIKDQPWKTLMNIASYINQQTGNITALNKPDRFIIISEPEAQLEFGLMGGRRLSLPLLSTHAELLWHVTYAFFMLRNQLKNREWTLTERVANKSEIMGRLLHGLTAFAIYVDFAGFNQQSIVHSYWAIHNKNKERIKNGY